MFICSECGTKYEIMPKFCDCGNDIFIEEEPPKIKTESNDFVPEEAPVRRKGRGKVESFSPAAVGTFILCLILSLVILFFVGNPKKDTLTQETPEEEKIEETIEIPSIESFWDNTIVKLEQKEEVKEKPKETPIIDMVPKFVQNILPQEEPKKVQTAPKPIQTVQPKTTKTQTQKTSSAAKPKQNQTSAPQQTAVQIAKTQQTQPVNTQAQAVTNRVKNNIQYNNPTNTTAKNTPQTQQTQPTQTVQTTHSAQTKTSAPSQQITPVQQTQTSQTTRTTSQATTQTPAPTPAVKTKSQSEITKELNNYKASLRNAIGRKIDFTRVIGDGDCTLIFKINSSGRLISKAFTKQSSNITLNDAVFNALNSTTSYNPPPEGYKGETLTLKIRFYNGNFEITLN